jgi:hypothetical protein
VLRSGAIESPLGASTFKTACFAALGGVIVALLHGSSPRTGNKGHSLLHELATENRAARREGFRSITKLVAAIRFGVGFRNSPMSANVQMSSATMHCSPLLTPTTSISSGKRRARRHYSAHFVTPEARCATQIR